MATVDLLIGVELMWSSFPVVSSRAFLATLAASLLLNGFRLVASRLLPDLRDSSVEFEASCGDMALLLAAASSAGP